MTKNIEQIKSFEEKLDQWLNNLKILQFNGKECIKLFAELLEQLYSSYHPSVFSIKTGFYILLPLFLKNKSTLPIKSYNNEELVKDLLFASHYKRLRDYLYYTYNTDNALKWNFKENRVIIKILDSSIFTQYYIEENNWFINSNNLVKQIEGKSDLIIKLLKGTTEYEQSENFGKARELILNEIALKFSYYYRFIPIDSNIKIKNYNYKQFYSIYKDIMFLALYSRYYARANQTESLTIFYSLENLVKGLCDTPDMTEDACKAILFDLSYSENKVDKDPSNYSLMYFEDSKEFLMIPTLVAFSNSFIDFLRIWAGRDPQLFLQKFSNELGKNFVEYIADFFESQDFKVHKNIKLKKLREDLTDIDLLIISKEPTFGFHIYVIEVKNPIPAKWGKYYLKGLGKQGYLQKALTQLEKIDKYLDSKKGIKLIYDFITKSYGDWSQEFKEGFVIGLKLLIVSSQNIGMFFKEGKKIIIDYQSLKRIVEKSDGDIVYINWALQTLLEECSKCYTIHKQKFKLRELNVEYEVSSFERMLDFQENKYKSIGLDKQIAEVGRKENYSFIRMLNKDFIKDFEKKGGKFRFAILSKENEDNPEDIKKEKKFLKGRKESI